MSSLWHVWSSVADASKSFIAATADDLRDFQHSLATETSEVIATAAAAAAASNGAQTQVQADGTADHAQPVATSDAVAEQSEPPAAAATATTTTTATEDDSNADQALNRLHVLSSSVWSSTKTLLQTVVTQTADAVDTAAQVASHAVSSASAAAVAVVANAPSSKSAAVNADANAAAAAAAAEQHADMMLLHLLRSKETYSTDPTESSEFASFVVEFERQFELKHSTDASRLLLNPTVRSFYQELVPNVCSPITFWARYFFKLQLVELAVQRRAKLVSRLQHAGQSSSNVDEFDWGDDEDDGNANEEENKGESYPVRDSWVPPARSSHVESDDDQDVDESDPSDPRVGPPASSDVARDRAEIDDADDGVLVSNEPAETATTTTMSAPTTTMSAPTTTTTTSTSDDTSDAADAQPHVPAPQHDSPVDGDSPVLVDGSELSPIALSDDSAHATPPSASSSTPPTSLESSLPPVQGDAGVANPAIESSESSEPDDVTSAQESVAAAAAAKPTPSASLDPSAAGGEDWADWE